MIDKETNKLTNNLLVQLTDKSKKRLRPNT